MSAVCILTPVVIMAWPAFSAAVVAAASSLGYQVAAEVKIGQPRSDLVHKDTNAVQLEIERSEVVTNQLGRDQRIVVTREGVTVTFSRDAVYRASILCVTGNGQNEETLRALGEELSQAVVQQYVYQKLMDETRSRAGST